jgi:hypothetical protein
VEEFSMRGLGSAVVQVMLLLMAAVSPAHALTLVEHVGNSDPTTEGWAVLVSSSPVGPLTNDAGFDAWFIDDTSASLLAQHVYNYDLSETDALSASTYGWAMTARVRVSPTSSSAFVIVVGDGTSSYKLEFGDTIPGPIVKFNHNNAVFGIDEGYHLYQIVHDATTDTADFYIDNVLVSADMPDDVGPAPNTQRLTWGTNFTGFVAVNSISLDVFSPIPEPSTALLVGGGLLALLGWRRRIG